MALLILLLAALPSPHPAPTGHGATDRVPRSAPRMDKAGPQDAPVTVIGEVVEGVECALVRTDDGLVYTLPSRAAPAPGTRVRVTGRVQAISLCQQGIPLSADRIERLQP